MRVKTDQSILYPVKAEESLEADSPWVIRHFIDTCPGFIAPGDSFAVGGVVVLSKDAPQGLVLELQSGDKTFDVHWGISSSHVARAVTDGANSAHARFLAENVTYQTGTDGFRLILRSAAGERVEIARLIVDPDSPREDIPFPDGELKRLEERKWILSYAPKHAVGAEIGVFRGHFSAILCEVLKPKKLYLVDPWRRVGKRFRWGKEYTGFGTLTTQYALDDTRLRIRPYERACDVRIRETFSLEFLAELERKGEKLDWAYLDASHAYDATLKELNAIEKVIANRGVLMGDDWSPQPSHKHHGVFRAVQEFIRTHPWELIAAGPGGQWCVRRRREGGSEHRAG